MWKCRKCGGKIESAEYTKNYYEVTENGETGEFIENSDWCTVGYYCRKCGRASKTYTLKALKRMAKYEE